VNKRAILHVDMDAFFAAIEQRDNPKLRGKPVVVGAGPRERGVVAAASYEARKFGIHSATPSRTAYKLCPQAVFVSPNFAKYKRVSEQIMAIFDRFTPLVEAVSIDEAFLDVSGAVKNFDDAVDIARKIKAQIRAETQLTASVGVAPNKFLAKLASDLNKPDGLTVIAEEEKIQILSPLPVTKIVGVGKVTAQKLHELGIQTIGDLQRYSVEKLRERFGNVAVELHALAHGEDDREVVTEEEAKSVSSEHTFDRDTADLDEIRRCLLEQSEKVARRLRRENMAARTVQLKLRYADFTTITRRKTLREPTQDELVLYRVAEQLLLAQNLKGKRIRLIGVGGSTLAKPEIQMELFERTAEKRARLAKSIDEIRTKLGPSAVKRARNVS
jgi:DNA polymerase-4